MAEWTAPTPMPHHPTPGHVTLNVAIGLLIAEQSAL